ncbi:hypothetical protein BT69DRAFT_1355942 [Atractiella rhizophila]|nr:hypothetical protein BT69DRAFT_1355942 [Atractiella rhizophila]
MSEALVNGRQCRNLVLCFDGTGNSFSNNLTNIIKLFSFLETDSPSQRCYYQPGIGTYEVPTMVGNIYFASSKVLDLAFATTMDAHIQQGYTFLMENYQNGDCIYLFGFSRGSATARALAGMLATVGLLPRGNAQQVRFAFDLFKKMPPDGVANSEFKRTFCRDVSVRFCGVWDTVSSTGLILSDLFPLSRNDRIQTFRQAISLDEKRVKFIYEPFFPSEGQDVKQLFFAGCHTDIGGGATEDDGDVSPRASHVPFRWMLLEAFRAGLLLDRSKLLSSPIYVDVCKDVILSKSSLYLSKPHNSTTSTSLSPTTTTEQPRPTPPPSIAEYLPPTDWLSMLFPRYPPPAYGEEITSSSISIEDLLVAGERSSHSKEGKDTVAPIHNSFSPKYANIFASCFYNCLEIVPLRWYDGEKEGEPHTTCGCHCWRPRYVPPGAEYHDSVKLRAEAPAPIRTTGSEVGGKYVPSPGWPKPATATSV